ncbi:unnamed protein product [Larinioides sclopetarius]|uniref:Speckle-type POZ protein n=1 Tax=Larinioides sclopetarius TaxID=280406 RepID=A0AAV2BYV3_9ARAC
MENEDRNMFVYIWKIENFSFAWQEVNEHFTSPSFQICATEGSSWRLKLYPRGILSTKNSLSLYLERESNVQGPVYLSVDYELSFLKSDGTPGYTAAEKACVLGKGQTSGFANLISREEIFRTKKSVFLPDDTLTVQCRISFENIGLARQIQAFAKSTIWIHRQLFLWDAGKFNYISPYEPGIFSALSFQTNEMVLNLNEDSIYVHLVINDLVNRMFRLRIGILDSNKSTSNFLIDEYIFNREKRSIKTLLISRSKLLQRKDLYLPEDHLILHCEWNYSRGVHVGQVDCHAYDKMFTFYTFNKKKDSNESPLPIAHSLCCANNYNSMKTDFQNLHQEGTLSDFTIKVGSETVRVHKAVLCARSSVFKAMLTSNMKETLKNQVDISDLDMDTVRRMLAYMYTDTAGDLDWETAKKLYFAADKYDITMLKRICSEFLKINLMAANVEDILTIANTHADEELKNVALKFLQCKANRQGSRSCTQTLSNSYAKLILK